MVHAHMQHETHFFNFGTLHMPACYDHRVLAKWYNSVQGILESESNYDDILAHVTAERKAIDDALKVVHIRMHFMY